MISFYIDAAWIFQTDPIFMIGNSIFLKKNKKKIIQ